MSIKTFNEEIAEMRKEFTFDDNAKFRIIGDNRTQYRFLEVRYSTENNTEVTLTRKLTKE